MPFLTVEQWRHRTRTREIQKHIQILYRNNVILFYIVIVKESYIGYVIITYSLRLLSN